MDKSVTFPAEPERWLPVVDYEGFYEVSDMGRVRSVPRKTASNNGRGMCYGKVLKPIFCEGADHFRVHLSRGGVKRKFTVHVLVARAFLGPRPDGLQVCHGPGGSFDNRLVNLSYGTPSKNNGADRWRDGTIPAGIRSSTAKLTDEQVLAIRARAAAGEPQASLAHEFGVGKSAIRKAVQGLTWKHVTGGGSPAQRGESHRNARLTEAAVRDIRARYAEHSATPAELARIYGLADSSLRKVIHRQTWKHVA